MYLIVSPMQIRQVINQPLSAANMEDTANGNHTIYRFHFGRFEQLHVEPNRRAGSWKGKWVEVPTTIT